MVYFHMARAMMPSSSSGTALATRARKVVSSRCSKRTRKVISSRCSKLVLGSGLRLTIEISGSLDEFRDTHSLRSGEHRDAPRNLTNISVRERLSSLSEQARESRSVVGGVDTDTEGSPLLARPVLL